MLRIKKEILWETFDSAHKEFKLVKAAKYILFQLQNSDPFIDLPQTLGSE